MINEGVKSFESLVTMKVDDTSTLVYVPSNIRLSDFDLSKKNVFFGIKHI